MWDKRSIVNIGLLLCYTALVDLYIYELIYGNWNVITARKFYYVVTVVFLSYLVFTYWRGINTNLQRHFYIISNLTVVSNFIIIALTLWNISPIIYLIVLNGSIFVLSSMIVISGIRHEYFKK